MSQLDGFGKGLVFVLFVIFVFYILFLILCFNQDRGNKCIKEGYQAVYDEFGIFEKCIKK